MCWMKTISNEVLKYNDKGGTGDTPDQAQKFPVDKDLQDDTVTSPVPILFHLVEPKKYQYLSIY